MEQESPRDTLLAFRLMPYRPGTKVKEVAHPKFYFFDSGVARACAGLLFEDLDSVYRGFLFETSLLNEIRAYNHYSEKNKPLSYYKISGGSEIDLIIELKRKTHSTPPELIAIEFKYATKWDGRFSEPMVEFEKTTKAKSIRKIGVYRGERRLTSKDVEIFPVEEFLEALHSGNIF